MSQQTTHRTSPAQSLRVVTRSPLEVRLAGQLHALEAWNAFRRQRERQLTSKDTERSRHEQMLARYELASMERTHEAVMERVALALARSADPGASSPTTVVIAHRSQWFGDRVQHLLEQRGMTVLERTDNGAWAMGVVIAEQPDCLFLSDRLAMLPGEQLLAHAEWYSPLTRPVVHAEETPEEQLQRPGWTVLRRGLHPDEVADALLATVATA